MPSRDVVLLGASAGGVAALVDLVGRLPKSFPAAVVVVVHLPRSSPSALPIILRRAGKLPVQFAHDGEQLVTGHVYVAPPDHHLLVQEKRLRLSHGPRINSHRPAVDPLFFSAARWLGPRAIACVLSGTLDDGAAGVVAVRRAGGVVIAQSPDEAQSAGMPRAAIVAGVDHVASLAEISTLLVGLTSEPLSPAVLDSPELAAARQEIRDPLEDLESTAVEDAKPIGGATGFTCPACHGALWELRTGDYAHYACRTGHAYGPENLFDAHDRVVEEAIWAGYRALEERAALSRRLAERARKSGMDLLAVEYEARAQESVDRGKVLRRVLDRGQLGGEARATEEDQGS